MAPLTLTELRKDLFRHIDEAIESGRPLRLKRRGQTYVFRPERERPPPAEDRWARYDAWIAERRARGEIPTLTEEESEVYEAEQDRLDLELKAEIQAEIEAEWDELEVLERSDP